MLFFRARRAAGEILRGFSEIAALEKSLGGDYPEVAGFLNNLAELYRKQDRLSEAEPFYERSLAIREKSLDNLALLYRKQGRETKADKLEARAREARARHEARNRRP